MENQKLENLLNLSLSVSEAEREKSSQLSTGFLTDFHYNKAIKFFHEGTRYAGIKKK